MKLLKAKISGTTDEPSTIILTTGELSPTTVTIKSFKHKSMKRILTYESFFVTFEDADAIPKCTCIAAELVNPRCPEHGE